MAFKEDIEVKDYFMKDYTKEEILKIFDLMLKRAKRTREIQGELEDTKITRHKWKNYYSRGKNKKRRRGTIISIQFAI